MSGALVRAKRKKALALISARRWREAQSLLADASRADPRDAETWCLLGAVNGELNLYDDAVACLEQAVRLVPGYADAQYNLAQATMHLGRYADAARAFEAFLRIHPGHVEALNTLGLALAASGMVRAAIERFQQALRIDRQHADAWYNLGNALWAFGSQADAVTALRESVHFRADVPARWIELGYFLLHSARLDEAQAAFDKARTLDPAQPDAVYGTAMVLERRGEISRAWELLRPLYESGTDELRFFQAAATVAKRVGLNAEIAARLELALEQGRIPPNGVMAARFVLAKLYEELGDYERAFPLFVAVKAASTTPDFDPADWLRRMAETREIFTARFFADAPRASVISERPVFIVGMPRSGTTLAEQIVASHPMVFGAGELSTMDEIVAWLDGQRPGARYPRCLERADSALLDAAASRYLAKLSALSADAPHVTDKLPHNFIHLGLIALLFPGAHIVHCSRHPIDNCVSIFTNEFFAVHSYAVDLRRLGEHYRAYTQLMEHWRQVLPMPIFELRYENLVADPEGTTRQLLAFLGLPWDDQCLRFYELDRSVNTLSYDQVRRPLYRRSIQRWRHYERHLGPLIESLGDISRVPFPASDTVITDR